jgi:UDP-N-acetylglucosamine 2-epimerase (non-hydrolysing)
MRPRTIAVFTGGRADFGLLCPLMNAIAQHPRLRLQVLVGEFPGAMSHAERVAAEGLGVAAVLTLPLADDSPTAAAQAMGVALSEAAQALGRLRPDVLVLLGDRFETLAVAQAAMLQRVPIAHLHGGERTEGAIDEAIRHALTKLSHWHFVAAEAFRQRVIQLGESPARVWTVGATGLDAIAAAPQRSREDLARELGIALLHAPLLLVTYHPVTLRDEARSGAVQALLQAVEAVAGTAIITGVNADPGHAGIRSAIDALAARLPGRVLAVDSLGSQRYLALMRHADVVLGNSSSGLLEAPSLGVPSVNVGARQAGRPRAPSVIDCTEDAASILRALHQALAPAHRNLAARCVTPYGEPGAARRIVEHLASEPLTGLLHKHFHDLPTACEQAEPVSP